MYTSLCIKFAETYARHYSPPNAPRSSHEREAPSFTAVRALYVGARALCRLARHHNSPRWWTDIDGASFSAVKIPGNPSVVYHRSTQHVSTRGQVSWISALQARPLPSTSGARQSMLKLAVAAQSLHDTAEPEMNLMLADACCIDHVAQ